MDGLRRAFLRGRQIARWAKLCLVAFAPLAIGSFDQTVIAFESVLSIVILVVTILPGHRTSRWNKPISIPLTLIVFSGFGILCILQLLPIPFMVDLLSPKASNLWQSNIDLTFSRLYPLTVDEPATSWELLRIIGLFALGLSQVIGIRREGIKEVRRLLWTITLVGLLSCILYILYWVMDSRKLLWFYTPELTEKLQHVFLATFVNPNHQGSFMGLCSICTLTLLLYSDNRTHRVLLLILFVANSMGLILTMSKGAWFAYGLGILIIIIIKTFQMKEEGTKTLFLWGSSAILVMVSLIGYVGYEEVVQEWKNLSRDTEAGMVVNRVEIWQCALKMFSDYPVLGIGRGANEAIFPLYNDFAPEETFHYLENEPLEALCEWGSIGGILLLLFAYSLIWKNRRMIYDPLCMGAMIGIISLAIHSLVDFGLRGNGIAIPGMALLACISAGVVSKKHLTERLEVIGVRLKRINLMLIGCGMLILGIFLSFKPFGNNIAQDLREIRTKTREGKLDLEEMKNVISRHPASYIFPLVMAEYAMVGADMASSKRWFERAFSLAPHNLRVQVVGIRHALYSGESEQAYAIFAEAKKRFSHTEILRRVYLDEKVRSRFVLFGDTNDIENIILVYKFLMQQRETQVGQRMLERSIRKNPNNVQLLVLLGKSYIETNDIPKVEAVLNKIMATKPEMPELYDLWGLLLHKQGKHLEAYHLFLEASSKMPTSCEVLFHAAYALLDAQAFEDCDKILDKISSTCTDENAKWRSIIIKSQCYEKQGRLRDAISAMLDADRMRPGMPETMRRIAKLYEANGDMPQAIFMLRKLLSLFPDDHQARQEIERMSRWGVGGQRR